MPEEQTIFRRIEKKYLITRLQYDWIIDAVRTHTCPDRHQSHTISSLYFDTPDHLLIRRSMDHPLYKEKLRLRTYGIPEESATAFAEIKKKYRKVVYKRRAEMTWRDAYAFLTTGTLPGGYADQQQILNEISWFLGHYRNLSPSMLISCDRAAYYGLRQPQLRITIDRQIRWRDMDLSPMGNVGGTPLLHPGLLLMEIKLPGAMPLWLAKLLAEARIYPVSFSKYATAYRQKLARRKINDA